MQGQVMSMNQQIRNFKVKTLPDLRTQLRTGSNRKVFEDILSNYLFVVGTGGNDYLHYFMSTEKDKRPLLEFTQYLISVLLQQLKVYVTF